jgi:hypothetical protein
MKVAFGTLDLAAAERLPYAERMDRAFPPFPP